MKQFFLTAVAVALGLVAQTAQADLVVTADNLDLRATVISGGANQAPNFGSIDFAPGFTPAQNNSESEDIVLRWSDLDLVGGTATGSDFIDFTFNVTVSSGAGNINFNGQGLRPNTWQPGETLTLSFVSATASAAGTVVFDGFTDAGFGTSGNASTADGSSATATVNGVSITNTMDGTGAYQYKNQDAGGFAASNSVVWNLVSEVDAGGGPIAESWTRNVDFGMTFTSVPEPSSLALIGLVGGMIALRRRR
ncbi:PEP-CTERM sorting domain-containing protein [Mariniblastus fucicola]|uniref:PEP-CTERM motif protein n=1 Tax=Mariniblastus fucicola TaxID=980251 RepID=A0A5B9P7Q6_9BACT|nr:PEP-CTERM sorting domain-containing protein [Mariniblastus fucicola]QEG21539.1 PEP-CTERM motif protein [Mariniblastus fucicola]